MAFIGLRCPVMAQMSDQQDGEIPEYRVGRILGRAIEANLTRTRNGNPLYADDVIDEDDNEITGMELSVRLNDIEDQQRYTLLQGQIASAGNDGYDECGASAPPVGFGYIRVRKKGGAMQYQAVWFWKCLFREDSEEAQSKGESIEWKTPTIQARVHGCYIDNTGTPKFRRRATFNTYEEAVRWLEQIGGVCIKNTIMTMVKFKDPQFKLKQVLTVPTLERPTNDFSSWPTEEEVADIEAEGFNPYVYNYTAVVNTPQGVDETDMELKGAGESTWNESAGLTEYWPVGTQIHRYYLKWGTSASEVKNFVITVSGKLGTRYYMFHIFHNYT